MKQSNTTPEKKLPKELELILYSRKDENSLFYENHLPLDLFKIIFRIYYKEFVIENRESFKKSMKKMIKYIYNNISLNYEKMLEHYKYLVPETKRDNAIYGNFKFDDLLDMFEYVDEKREDDKYFLNKSTFNQKKLKDITFDFFDKITIFNCAGINQDERGVRILDTVLHFWPKYEIINKNGAEISLKDIAIGLYKVKSHKFENWYELYVGHEITFKNNKAIITIDFDHGS